MIKNHQAVFDIRKVLFISTVFIFTSYIGCIPLLKYETWPGGHDSYGTIFNALIMLKTMWEDPHIPIIWQADNCSFKGNPHWAFYQPLSFIVVYLASLATSIFDHNFVFSSLKMAVFLSFFISEIGMFLLLREIFKNHSSKNLISTFGAVIFLFAPYRFIDIYSRNAYSELWIFTWAPFYFLGFYKLLFQKEKSAWIYIAIFTPVLMISHLMPSFFFIIIIHLGFIIFLLIKKKLFSYPKENFEIIKCWSLGNIIGIASSLTYIIPAMNTLKYLNGDLYGFDRVDLNTVLDHIEWCYAFLDLTNFGDRWQAGQLYLISSFVLLFFVFAKKNSIYRDLIIFIVISTIVTLLFLLSRTLWHLVPPIFYGLQFSWRLFVVYSFLCSISMAIIASEYNLKIPALILIIVLHYYTGERFVHHGGEDLVNKFYNSESWQNDMYRSHHTVLNSHSPHSVLVKVSDPVLFGFKHADELGANEKYSNTFIYNLKPGINILSHQRKGNSFFYDMLLDSSSFIIFKQYFHNTWRLYIDSKKIKDIYLTEKGFIGFEVPKGRHLIKLRTD